MKPSRASQLLHGKSLIWLSWDRLGIVTTAVRRMVIEELNAQEVSLELVRSANLDELLLAAERQTCGLVSFVLQDFEDCPAACKSLWRFRNSSSSTIRVVVIAPEMAEQAGLLLEAGAQVVVSQLTSLQNTLSKVVQAAPLSKHGFHPLTSRLVDQLPWPNL